MPKAPPEPDYPAEAAVRRVRSNGEIKWKGGLVYVSQTLAGEPMAIEETCEGDWAVRFYAHPIGVIDKCLGKLRRRGVLPGQDVAAGAPKL